MKEKENWRIGKTTAQKKEKGKDVWEKKKIVEQECVYEESSGITRYLGRDRADEGNTVRSR